jgi:hypothetical protein
MNMMTTMEPPGRVSPRFRIANRREIEQEIERLIGLLDAADAPFEGLEPEEDIEHDGREEQEVMPVRPVYGLDQSKGPTNEREGYRAYRKAKGWPA